MLEVLEWSIYNIGELFYEYCGLFALSNFRMRWRSRYPLTLKQRITYPLFMIRMLNHFETPEESKKDIIEKFIIPFMNNEPGFRDKYYNDYMCFHENTYAGILNCDEKDLYIDNYIKDNNLKERNISRDTFFFIMPITRGFIFTSSNIPYYEPKLNFESFYKIRYE